MLSNAKIVEFFNRLQYAGLSPNIYTEDFKKSMLVDFSKRFKQRLTDEELDRAAELLQTNATWPNYREIEEAVASVRNTEEALVSERLENAYPEGDSWREVAMAFGRQCFADMTEQELSNNVLNIHWLLKTQQKCQTCAGFSCGYCGHKPYLRRSANGKELYKCVEMSCCEKYKSKLN